MKPISIKWLIIYFILLIPITGSKNLSAQEIEKSSFPEVISFKGYLTDNEGAVFPDAIYNFIFSIYSSPDAKTPLWSEVHKNVSVRNGEFQIILGKGDEAKPLDLPFDTKYYLGIKINDNPEATERLEFVASPYSLAAKAAETVADNSVTGEKFTSGSVTNDKIKNISLRKIVNIPPGIGNIDKISKHATIQGSDYEWWTTFGNLIWGPERHFLGTRNERNFVIGTNEIQRMLFDPYGYIVLGTAADSVNFEVIGKTTFVDGYIKGKLGVGVDPAEAKMHINTDGIDPLRIDFQNSTVFNVDEKGRVVITSGLSGGEDDLDNYTLNIDGVDQGIAIRVDGTANGDNNYMSFWDDDGMVGRIEGQTALEYLADPKNIATDVYLAALIAAEVVAAVSYLYPLPIPTEPADIISTAANIVEVTFVTGWEMGHLGVTYESGSGDYAEWLQREFTDEEILAGDIIGIKGGKISKNTDEAEYYSIVSTAPIILGNMPGKENKTNYEKVAFMGQVPVKVIGPVNVGDFIIPSGLRDGTGIAVAPELITADEFSQVVGRAWSAASSDKIKSIKVLVGNDERYSMRMLGKKMDSSELNAEVGRYELQIQDLNELADSVERKSVRIKNIINNFKK